VISDDYIIAAQDAEERCLGSDDSFHPVDILAGTKRPDTAQRPDQAIGFPLVLPENSAGRPLRVRGADWVEGS
jgi:hypothetical protein